ncbi:MAG TPA: protein kinase [Phycisphaerae bacterium]|nr:protein kinase [Phycisphaerae bacterium]HRW51789.1 protein kinase [Phycisphaerae bacterium]
MTPERYRRVCDLFHLACDIPESDRAAFIADQADGDSDLIAAVEALLANDDGMGFAAADSGGLVQNILGDSDVVSLHDAANDENTPPLPASIGPYKVLRKLGEGGMGVVYEAIQTNPARRVALKILRPRFATGQMLRRFAHEVQIQGQLNHPGIGHVYDAGVERTQHGTFPYFAMELVDGRPITQFAREEQLDTPARLALMIEICQAVQHAHDHGVIHRDLKPANIVIPMNGHPKVLDFGIARVTDSDLQLTTIQTAAGQLLGTLPYMSPEQVAGQGATLDRRSDIYSLGVVLYELLADRPPFDLSSRSIPEATLIIKDEDPPRLGSVNIRYRGEIEAIVNKALEKDIARRYETVHELAADLQRVLSDEPVRARPPSTLYQLSRFTRRNKALVGGVVATMFALLIGLVGAASFAYRESRQRALAERAQEEAQRQSYRVSVAAAANALEGRNVLAARQLLRQAPSVYRGWEWWYLRALVDTSVRTIRTNVDSIDMLRYSDDGNTLIGHFVHSYARWDLQSGRSIDVYRGVASCEAVASPDFTCFAGLDATGGIQIHDVTLDQRFQIDDAPQEVESLAISRRNDLIALTTTQRQFQIRRIQTGELIFDARLPERSRRMAWSPTQDILAVRLEDHLTLFDANENRIRARVPMTHDEKRGELRWNPEGRIVYLANHTDFTGVGQLRRVNADDGKELAPLIGHTRMPQSIEFAQDGERLLTSGHDGTARLWDVGAAQLLATLKVDFGAAFSARISPDGALIAVGDSIGAVHVFNADTFEPVTILTGHESPVQSITFSPDGQFIVAGAGDGCIRFWPISKARQTQVLRGHQSYVYPVVFSPDGSQIASASWDGTIRTWDAQTAETTRVMTGQAYPPYFLAFDRRGARLVSYGHSDRTVNEVIVNDLRDGGQYRITGERQRPCMAPAFHTDDDLIWLPRTPGPTARFWRYRTGEIEERPVSELGHVESPLISPDATMALLIAGDNQTLSVISTATGAVVHQIVDNAMHAAWSPDGHRIVVIYRSSRDKQDGDRICVWDVRTGARIGDLKAHVGGVFDARYSPDGTRIMSCGRDEKIRIWDAVSLMHLISLSGHTEYVWSIAFDTTGQRLISGSGDNTVRIWDSDPDANVNVDSDEG